MAVDVDLGDDFNIGNVDRLRLTILKRNATTGVYEPWLGIDSVQLTFEGPDLLDEARPVPTFTRSATPEGGDAAVTNVWYYDTVASDLTVPGGWTVSVKITDGSVVKTYGGEIGFHVNDR